MIGHQYNEIEIIKSIIIIIQFPQNLPNVKLTNLLYITHNNTKRITVPKPNKLKLATKLYDNLLELN